MSYIAIESKNKHIMSYNSKHYFQIVNIQDDFFTKGTYENRSSFNRFDTLELAKNMLTEARSHNPEFEDAWIEEVKLVRTTVEI